MSSFNPSVGQGIDLIFTTTNTDSAGVAINITGFTIIMAVSNKATNAFILTITNGSGITLTTPLLGIATYRFTAAQTAALPAGTYNYGIKATSSGGISYDWADGTFTIEQART